MLKRILALMLIAGSVQAATIDLGTVPTLKMVTNIVQGMLIQGTNIFLVIDATGRITIHSGGTNELGGVGDVTAASNFGADNMVLRSDGVNKGVQGSAVFVNDNGVQTNVVDTGYVDDTSWTNVFVMRDPITTEEFYIQFRGGSFNPSIRWIGANDVGGGLIYSAQNGIDTDAAARFGAGLSTDGNTVLGDDQLDEHTIMGNIAQHGRQWLMQSGVVVTNLTADKNNWLPTDFNYKHTLYLTSDADRTVTGLAQAPQDAIVFVYNKGVYNITFANESGSSTEANRFSLDADLVLASKQGAIFRYDVTDSRWRVLFGSGGGSGGTLTESSDLPVIYTTVEAASAFNFNPIAMASYQTIASASVTARSGVNGQLNFSVGFSHYYLTDAYQLDVRLYNATTATELKTWRINPHAPVDVENIAAFSQSFTYTPVNSSANTYQLQVRKTNTNPGIWQIVNTPPAYMTIAEVRQVLYDVAGGGGEGGGSGDIEGVTAGAGLSGGGTSGTVTVNIGAGTGIIVNADDIAATLGTSIDSAEIEDGSILNGDINGSAAIDATKIADGSVSSVEFQRLDGLSDDLTTLLAAKITAAGGTGTGNALTDSTMLGDFVISHEGTLFESITDALLGNYFRISTNYASEVPKRMGGLEINTGSPVVLGTNNFDFQSGPVQLIIHGKSDWSFLSPGQDEGGHAGVWHMPIYTNNVYVRSWRMSPLTYNSSYELRFVAGTNEHGISLDEDDVAAGKTGTAMFDMTTSGGFVLTGNETRIDSVDRSAPAGQQIIRQAINSGIYSLSMRTNAGSADKQRGIDVTFNSPGVSNSFQIIMDSARTDIVGGPLFVQNDLSVGGGDIVTQTGDLNIQPAGGDTTVTGALGVTGVISGDGSGLTSLNASELDSGTVPDAAFPAVLPAVSGEDLTDLNASAIGSGTLAAARVDQAGTYVWTGPQTVQDGAKVFHDHGNQSGTVTVSLTTNVHKITLTAPITVDWINFRSSGVRQFWTVDYIQSSGGDTVAYDTGDDPEGTDPTIASGAGEITQVLYWTDDGGTTIYASTQSAGSGITAVVEDTSPQLGGDLDVNGNRVGSPDGTDGVDIVNGGIDIQSNNSSRVDITDSGVRLGGANARITTILDEDNMATDSATAGVTQQSVKAYADSKDFRSLVVADLGDTATPHVLTTAETINTIISNYDASGEDREFRLPAAHAKGNVTFMIGDEFEVGIEPTSADNFILNGVAMATDEHIINNSDALYGTIVAVCVNINGTFKWVLKSDDANWVEATP